MVPASAAFASVVGLPSASNAQPSGIGSSFCAWTMISLLATTLDDWSITIGGPSWRGTPQAIGLVPNTGRVPPQGAIDPGALTKPSPTRPSLAIRSMW